MLGAKVYDLFLYTFSTTTSLWKYFLIPHTFRFQHYENIVNILLVSWASLFEADVLWEAFLNPVEELQVTHCKQNKENKQHLPKEPKHIVKRSFSEMMIITQDY